MAITEDGSCPAEGARLLKISSEGQLKLFVKVGISDSTLHRMEMAEQNVTLKTLEQICERLTCKISDVFDE